MQQQSPISNSKNAPGPREWPLIGNVGIVQGFIPFLQNTWRTYGDIFRVRLVGFRPLVLANPKDIHQVLVSGRTNYLKGPTYDPPRKLMGQGLITSEGEIWKSHRALAQPAFHRLALERLTSTILTTGAEWCETLERRASARSIEVDVNTEMVRLTLEVVVNTLFGRGMLANANVDYELLGHALEFVADGSANVVPEWVPTPRNLRFKRTLHSLNDSVYQIIRTARARSAHDGSLLDLLLGARSEDGGSLDDAALRDEVITLFIAGHETTALTLTWMFALLSEDPAILDRMKREVDDVLQGRDPTFGDVPKLVYVRQVIDETLRMRPPLALIGRDTVADDTIGGVAVRPGDIVAPFIWGAHFHPDYWQTPSRFDPDRFAPGLQKARHPSCYLPFSNGPRTCIGNAFALIEMVVLVAQLLNRFELEPLKTPQLEPSFLGTLRPSKPVKMRVRRRSPRTGSSRSTSGTVPLVSA